LAAFAPGVVYWNGIHAHWARCLYGDPVCSLTVSTYLLATLTIGAFLAAYKAARYAQQTLEMEREVVLAIDSCNRVALEFSDAEREKTHSMHGSFNSTAITKHEPHRSEERFLQRIDRDFEAIRPDDFNAQQYLPLAFDCHSLGRSALINGALLLNGSLPDAKPNPLRIEVGSIPADEFVHIVLWISKDLDKVEFEWQEIAIHRDGSEHQANVECNPRDKKFGAKVGAYRKTTPPEPPPDPETVKVNL
jgi:hypothetical protein